MKIAVLIPDINNNSPCSIRAKNLYLPLNDYSGISVKANSVKLCFRNSLISNKNQKIIYRIFGKIPLMFIFYYFNIIQKMLKTSDFIISVNSSNCITLFYYLLLNFIKIKYPAKITIMDLGDPFAFNPVNNRNKVFMYSMMEKYLINRVDCLFVTTEQTKSLYINKIKKTKKIFVIEQATTKSNDKTVINDIYDGKYFKKNKINLLYTGRFYKKIREPYEFYKALEAIYFKTDEIFNLVIIGNIDNPFIPKKINFYYQIHATIDNEYICNLQRKADVLLLFGNDSQYQLPGKIFEYAGSTTRVLSIINTTTDLSIPIVKKFNLGKYCFNRSSDIQEALEDIYSNYLENNYQIKKNKKIEKGIYWIDRREEIKNILNLFHYE
ncbi:MAG: hypothetical protein JXA99_11645 [Candidatus Lokiarchaeota archaeon]|nr:hypothetical protein [Candidatus Lokiarchaeota archaeon]